MHRPPPPRGPSGQPGLRPGQPGQPGGPRFNPVEMVTHDLDLDTEQRKVLQGLFDQYAKARRGRLADPALARADGGGNGRHAARHDEDRRARRSSEVELRAEQQKETLRTFAQLEPSLRPDQRERLQRLLVDRLSPPPPPPRPPAGGPPRPPCNRRPVVSTRLGRRRFVGGAAALSAGLSSNLWSALPRALPRRWASTMRGISCREPRLA